MKSPSYGIHWFRRDLRVAGNLALHHNWKQNQGRVVGLFCFDAKFLSRPDFSANRFQFFLNTLESLRDEMRQIGSDILFSDQTPQDTFPQLLKETPSPGLISWNRDYEPFARKRDAEMETLLKQRGIPFFHSRDHLLIEPHELAKPGADSGFYKVYSPFARRWLEIFQEPMIQKRIERQKQSLQYLEKTKQGPLAKSFSLTWNDLLKESSPYKQRDKLHHYQTQNGQKVSVTIPQGGSLKAYEACQAFSKKLDGYQEKRDFPSEAGTSGLSLFLKNGSITTTQIIALLGLKAYEKKTTSRDTFLSELIWREFYYHILFHVPRVETESFLLHYKNLKWENDPTKFEAWKKGLTGFPIVDAGMRQLKQTGWMHNRVRMIVASFLVKDLHIDWRWGEKYFMEQLLDGDLAPNNGGWQWAASTGCDPQPYFRIFNPWLQAQKFDPQALYIKKYLPELKELTAKQIHAPIHGHQLYPSPIVDHSKARDKALQMYKGQRGLP